MIKNEKKKKDKKSIKSHISESDNADDDDDDNTINAQPTVKTTAVIGHHDSLLHLVPILTIIRACSVAAHVLVYKTRYR